jgi:hypothetical protein
MTLFIFFAIFYYQPKIIKLIIRAINECQQVPLETDAHQTQDGNPYFWFRVESIDLKQKVNKREETNNLWKHEA